MPGQLDGQLGREALPGNKHVLMKHPESGLNFLKKYFQSPAVGESWPVGHDGDKTGGDVEPLWHDHMAEALLRLSIVDSDPVNVEDGLVAGQLQDHILIFIPKHTMILSSSHLNTIFTRPQIHVLDNVDSTCQEAPNSRAHPARQSPCCSAEVLPPL